MADDFNYLNARIRAMRGRLLTASDLRAMTGSGGMEELLARLRETSYGPALQSALSRRPGLAGVDEGLRDTLSLALARLVSMSSGRARDLILLIVARWEKQCVKTVLRGKARQASPEQIAAAAVPAGTMDEAAIRELSHLGTVGDVIDLLRLWGYPPARALRRAWISSGRKGDLQRLEAVLDQSCLDFALERLDESGRAGEAYRGYLVLDVDLTNILNALRLLQARSSPPGGGHGLFLARGRRVSRERFSALLSLSGISAAIHSLGDTHFGGLFLDALPGYLQTGRLSLFENAADRRLHLQALRAARHDPLGIGVAVGFLSTLAVQVADLRLLTRAAAIGMPPVEVLKELSAAR